MDKIDHLQEVWDNGAISRASLTGNEIDHFKEQMGAKRVVATRWKCGGKELETPYYVRLLKDGSGLVHFDCGDLCSGRLVVMNGDGSKRVVISVPRIDRRSHPEDTCLNLPPSSAHFGGIEWGCEGNDGHTDYLFDFEWHTGKLLRYARPTRPW